MFQPSDSFKKRIGAYTDHVVGLFKDAKTVDSVRTFVMKNRAPPPISYHAYLEWVKKWPPGERVYDITYKRYGTVEKVSGDFPYEDPRVCVRFDDGHVMCFGIRVESVRPLNALEKLAEI